MGTLFIIDFKARKLINKIEYENIEPKSRMYLALSDLEKELIIDALNYSYGINEAAFFLDMSLEQIRKKFRMYGINPSKYLKKV